MQSLALLLSAATLATAHFKVDYPTWRGDSFTSPASQWIYPCANVNSTSLSAGNGNLTSSTNQSTTATRTPWPLDGGSISMRPSHPWAFTYINVGLGSDPGNFNITLLENFNQTGNGTFCLPKIGQAQLDGAVKEGDNATIQIIQISHSGSALYNCADITFSSSATLLSGDKCVNSTGVGGIAIANVNSTPSAAGAFTAPKVLATSVGALVALLML